MRVLRRAGFLDAFIFTVALVFLKPAAAGTLAHSRIFSSKFEIQLHKPKLRQSYERDNAETIRRDTGA